MGDIDERMARVLFSLRKQGQELADAYRAEKSKPSVHSGLLGYLTIASTEDLRYLALEYAIEQEFELLGFVTEELEIRKKLDREIVKDVTGKERGRVKEDVETHKG